MAKAASLLKSGDAAQAEALYREVLDRFPGNKAAKTGLAKCQNGAATAQTVLELYRAGKLVPARDMGERLLRSDPQNLLLLNLLGAISGGLNAPRTAIQYLRQSVRLDPTQSTSHANLGKALLDAGRVGEAVASLRKALSIKANDAATLNNLGNALVKTGEIDPALAAYRKALTAKPDYVEAKMSLAMALKDLDQIDEAITLCHEVLAIRPGYTQCYRNLASFTKFKPGDPLIAQMEALLPKLQEDGDDAMNIHFALAKAYGDVKAVDAAFAALQRGSAIHRRQSGYELEADAKVFEQIQGVFEAALPPSPPLKPDPLMPVLICGMPRSGTTLVEQILASHSAVHGAGEIPFLYQRAARLVNLAASDMPLDQTEMTTFAQGYLDDLKGLGVAEQVICDKTPSNFRFLGFVFSSLPNAKVIHIHRDPMAVGWSIYKHFFPSAGMDYSYDLQTIAGYYQLYEKIMAFWRVKFPDRFIDVCYETLTENQEAESRRILAHCGLDWEDAVLAFHRTKRIVQTASTGQVRQPMYKGSSEAWRAYAKHLKPLSDALEQLPKR